MQTKRQVINNVNYLLKHGDIDLRTAKKILLEELNPWRLASSESPPEFIPLVVKSPEDNLQISQWHSANKRFTCQDYGDDIDNWQWKLV
jgi:hypothetical protein